MLDLEKLAQARTAGYSDDEIYDHLTQQDPRFAVAKQHGYSLEDVASHLSPLKQEMDALNRSPEAARIPVVEGTERTREAYNQAALPGQPLIAPRYTQEQQTADFNESRITLPRNKAEGTMAGIENSIAENIEGLSSTKNLGIAALAAPLGGAPKVVQKLASAGFALFMGSQLPEAKEKIGAANTAKERAQAVTDFIFGAGMALTAASHGIGTSTAEVGLRKAGLSGDDLAKLNTQLALKDMAPKETTEGRTFPHTPDEIVDGLNFSKQKLREGMAGLPPEKQQQRQALLDTIEGQLLEVPREKVTASEERIKQQAATPPAEVPPAGDTAEVPSPPVQGGRSSAFTQALREQGAPLTAEAVESLPVEEPPTPPAAEEEKLSGDKIPAEAAGGTSNIAGPALLSDGEIAVKGQIGQKHADLIKSAVATGNVDAVVGERGFHDEEGKPLTRTEAAERALKTGQIDQATFDKAMARDERGLHSEDLMKGGDPVEKENAQKVQEEGLLKPESAAVQPGEQASPKPGAKLADDLRKLGRVNRDPAESVARELKYYSDEERQQLQDHLGTPDAKPDTLAKAITGKSKIKETSRPSEYIDEPGGKEGRGHPTADVAKEAFGEDYTGGPGAMGPREAEAMKSAQAITGLKKVTVLVERLARGEEPLPEAERQSEEEAVQRAVETQDRDPKAAQNLVSRILDTGDTAISRDDAALLLVERNRVLEDMRQADAKLNNESASPLERAEAQASLKDLETQIDRLDRAQKEAGSQWGRVGRMYQRMIREDYSLEGIQRKMRTAKGGPLDEGERAQAETAAAKMDEAIKARDAAEKKLAEDLKADYEKQIAGLKAELDKVPKVSQTVFDIAQKIVDRWKVDADEARKSLRERLGRTSAGVDPTIVLDVARIMRSHVGEIGLDLAKVSARVLEDFGDAVKPFLKDAWEKTKELIDKETMEPATKAAVKKGTSNAPKPTKEEIYNKRRMTQITKQIADLEERLKTGNFEKEKPVPLKKTAEVAAAEAKLTEVRREVDKAIEKKKYEQLSPQQKLLKEAMSTFRSITALKILGHGSVGMVTHAGGVIFRPTRAAIYWKNFGRQFGMWHDKAYHDQLIYRLKNDPEFETWKKAGASIDPEKTYTDYGMYAQWLGKLGEKGARGFDALKLVRMEMNKADWSRVPEEIKNDPKQADAARKLIAEINNKATGATPKTNPMGKTLEEGFYNVTKNPVLEAAFFAPRLYASRWGRVLFDPVKTARTLFDPQSSPADVFAAKTRLKNAAEFTGTLVAALLTNQAILSATGSKQNVNLTDPTKSDWLKFKAGDKTLTADGGLLDPVRLLGQVIWKDLLADRTAQQQYREGSRYKKAVDTVGSYLRGKLNPPVGLAADLATGSDFQGRPLPWNKEKPQFKGQDPYTLGEYVVSQGPIPLAGAAKEIAADLHAKGFKDREIQVVLKAIATFGLGMAGVHVGEDYSTQPKSSGGGPSVKLKRR